MILNSTLRRCSGQLMRSRLDPFHQHADAPAGGAEAVVGELAFGVGDTGDVEVGPGGFFGDEEAEEFGALEGTRSHGAAGGIDDVGGVTLDALADVVGNGQAPDFF